jgi:hypothetical protein
MQPTQSQQKWNAGRYEEHAHFVPALGQAVLDLLAPRAGERILDLAVGTEFSPKDRGGGRERSRHRQLF